MKRWDIGAPCSSQYREDPAGEWVEYDDIKAKLDRLEQAEALLRHCRLALLALGGSALALDVDSFIEKRVSSPANPKG